MATSPAPAHLRLVSARAATTPIDPTEGDSRPLTVDIRPYGLEFWEFLGSRAQLEAEGAIPAGTPWPDGIAGHRWQDGALSFWLRRTRPPGFKGPRKLWLQGDQWALRCSFNSGLSYLELVAQRKQRELAALQARLTPSGQCAHNALLRRYWQASDDAAFRHFKSLVPGLLPPKRGRKPSSSPKGAQQ